MKKSILTLALAILMVAALSAPALAADVDVTTAGGTGNTTFTYTVAQSFVVTIPAAVTIESNMSGSMEVSVAENAYIAREKNLVIRLTTCDFTFTNEGDDLLYTIKTDYDETTIELNDAVMTYESGSQTGATKVLDIAITENPVYSGDYTDTVTFTVSIENAA